MIFANKDNEIKMVVVNCNCGCNETIAIKKYVDSDNSDIDDEYYLSILASKFYEGQDRKIFKTILHRINLAWKMLLGKEYLLSEIVISKDEFEEFKDKIKEL